MLTGNEDQWCQGETANCPTLCGGQTQTKANSCTGVSPTQDSSQLQRHHHRHHHRHQHPHQPSHSPTLNPFFNPKRPPPNLANKPLLVNPRLHLHLRQRHRSLKHSRIPRHPAQLHLRSHFRPMPYRQPRLRSLQDLRYPHAFRRSSHRF